MRIHIQAQGFKLTSAIDSHVRDQLSHHFHTMEDHIVAVDVYLSDVNGPRGGKDKRGLVYVRLASQLTVKVEALHDDLYAAVSIAARRTRRAMKRTLRRHNRIKRKELRALRHYQGELQAQ